MKIKTVAIQYNKLKPCVKEIKNSLEALQNFVGGYIEVFLLGRFTGDNVVVILDEEGKLNGKPATAELYHKAKPVDVLCGNFLICGTNDDGDFISLTDEQIEKYINLFSPFFVEL